MLRLPLSAILGVLIAAITAVSLRAAPFVPARNAHCVAFSPDGRLLATGKSGMSDSRFPPRPHPSPRKCGVIEMWDIETGNRLWRTETFGDLTRLGFSPDGKTVASSRLFATADGLALNEVHLYDADTGAPLHQFNRCHGFDFSPDGERIAVLSRTKCVLFTSESYERLQEVEPLGGALYVTFVPSADQLAGICRTDEGEYVVRICDVKTGRRFGQSPGFEHPFYNVCFSPRGDMFATGHDDGLCLLWDAARMTVAAKLQTGGQGIQHAFFSPDGTLAAAGDQALGDVAFFDVTTGNELRRWTYKQGSVRTYLRRDAEATERPEQDPGRFAFSPDGTTFAAGCHGALIRVVETGQIVRQFGD